MQSLQAYTTQNTFAFSSQSPLVSNDINLQSNRQHEEKENMNYNNMLLNNYTNYISQQQQIISNKQLKQSKTFPSDRFIPIRNSDSMELANYLLFNGDSQLTYGNNSVQEQSESQSFSKLKDHAFFMGQQYINNNNNNRVMQYQQKIEQPISLSDTLSTLYQRAEKTGEIKKTTRYIPQAPEKILDAPDIVDDYYLNLIDWGSTNQLAVSLGQSVYLWDATSGNIQQLLQINDGSSYVTSVSWVERGNCLAVGLSNNIVQLWDSEKFQPIRNLYGHQSRVSSLSWNNSILSSGGKDSCIINSDVRLPKAIISTFRTHTQEICGLKWSPDGTQLASGGNDNMLCIWSITQTQPRFILQEHKAAVKALAWCPWQNNLLASGGGTADKTIKFWNTETGGMINNINAESQVCGLVWNKYDKEILSAHGFSKNQLCLWKYPTLNKIGELTGHTNRVLNLAQSPDGTMVVSAAADETLRFWKIFDIPEGDSYKKYHKNVFAGIGLRQL